MTQETEQDQLAWPADMVATLDEVDPKWRDDYEPAADGFALKPVVKAALDRYKQLEAEDAERRLAELANAEAERVKLAATEVTLKAALRERIAKRAIADALRIGGCKPSLIAGATALLLNELPLSLAEIDGEPVAVLDGGWTVETAVGSWLTSEAGRAFIEPVKTVGIFADAIRRLH
jgi:hypothetical protein